MVEFDLKNRHIYYKGSLSKILIDSRLWLSRFLGVIFYCSLLYCLFKDKKYRRMYTGPFIGMFVLYINALGFPENNFDKFKEKGIDDIYVVSVNDAFVMNAWASDLGIKNIKIIPDGNCEFTTAMGMNVTKSNLGFGIRSWRYAAIIDNCKIEKIFEEPGKSDDFSEDPYGETAPENIMSHL